MILFAHFFLLVYSKKVDAMKLNTPTFDPPACAEPRCRAARLVLWGFLLLTFLPWLSIPSLPCEGETLLMFPFLTWPLLILLVAAAPHAHTRS